MSYYEVSEILNLQRSATTSTLQFHANAGRYKLLRGQLAVTSDTVLYDADIAGRDDDKATTVNNDLERKKQPPKTIRRPVAAIPDTLKEAMQREAQALLGERVQRTRSRPDITDPPERKEEPYEAPLPATIGTKHNKSPESVLDLRKDTTEESDTSDSVPDVLLLDIKSIQCASISDAEIPLELPVEGTNLTQSDGCANLSITKFRAAPVSTSSAPGVSECSLSTDIFDVSELHYNYEMADDPSQFDFEVGTVEISLSSSNTDHSKSTVESRTNRFVRGDEKTSRSSRGSSEVLKLNSRRSQPNYDYFCRGCKMQLTASEVAEGVPEMAQKTCQELSSVNENGDANLMGNDKEAPSENSLEQGNLSPQSRRRRDWKAKKGVCRMNPNLDTFDIIPGWGDAPRRQIQWEETVPREIWSRTVRAADEDLESSIASWLTTEIDEAKRRVGSPAAAGRLEQWLDHLEVETSSKLVTGDLISPQPIHTAQPSSVCSVSTHTGMRPAVE